MTSLVRCLVLVLMLGIGLTSCTSVPFRADLKTIYRMDMRVCVNGKCGDGFVVAPRSDQYKFEIDAKGTLDLFTLTTCHREIVMENAGQGGLFGNKKHIKYYLTPSSGVESDQYACPVHLGGYEKMKGRHSWGFVDFEHPKLALEAELLCNGWRSSHKGVSVCQSKTGLIQEIIFPVEVSTSDLNPCPAPTSSDSKSFQIDMPAGQCSYRFIEKKGKKKHRLTTLGYEQVLIRED